MLRSSASERTLSFRIAAGAACGIAAFALNQIPAPILSRESPGFALGGAFVLFAFWQLGTVPGLIATLIGYAAGAGVPEVTIAVMVTYAIEGFVATRLASRTRSLVVADVLFWLVGGALLDVLVFGWWVGLSAGYVLLLLVKHLLNGVMNAVIANSASNARAMRRLLRVPPSPASSWQEVLFDRTVPLVLVPMTVIVLLLARASHAANRSRIAAELRQSAAKAEEGADQFLQFRLASFVTLRTDLGMAGVSPVGRTQGVLDRFLVAHPEFLNVFVTDETGVVTFAAPARSSTGVAYRGTNISRRPYFAEARATDRPVFGALVLSQLHVRRPGVEPVLPLATPLLRRGGGFGGVLMAGLDATTLRAILTARIGNRAGAAQLLDRSDRVVASTAPEWTPGTPRAPELVDVLANGGGQLVAVEPRHVDSYASLLGVDPRLTIGQPVSSFPFVVLVDEPASTVHRALIPTSLALIALMLVAILAVYAVARRLGAQFSAPLRSIGAVAEDLADGHHVSHAVLARFEASPVQEIRALAAQLLRMDDALRERRQADATAVQESETKYRETLEQLVQAQKTEGIGRLAGGIAHDFNNLLTPILGYTDLALAGVPAGSPARKDLALVRTAAGRAKEVVAQLLAFGRAQVLDTQRIDLAEVVAEFEPLLRRTLSASIDLVVFAEPGIVVEADRAKVQQVLMNLVINAADAMPNGGRVEVRVGLEELGAPDAADPEPLLPGSYGVITVNDTGVGMGDDTRRRAFDPFFTTKPRGKGTGLGLSTAYGIVRQHRGTITVESAAGEGTRMRVLLPVATPAPHLVTNLSPIPDVQLGHAAMPEGVTLTLLVVEDESSVRELARAVLARAGYRVLAARDGDEALTRAAAHIGRIDLLLTDVVMPGLNGREVARRFRAARPDARVVFMSGYASDVVADEGMLAGDADLLVKPFTPDELVARVRTALLS